MNGSEPVNRYLAFFARLDITLGKSFDVNELQSHRPILTLANEAA